MGRRDDELRATVSTLQAALDAAHRRIREQEQAAAEVNRRLAEAMAARDDLETQLYNERARRA